MSASSLDKDSIRREVWRLMEDAEVTRFPKPVVGRIPNFIGAEKAAEQLIRQSGFRRAGVVKVNPDSPQTPVRKHVLSKGKTLLMPSPRLRRGFILLDPTKIPRKFLTKTSTIKGSFKHGSFPSLERLPRVDLIVAGSVAVTRFGTRVGKGGGYSEIEYGILRELDLVNEKTPIFTTVHDLQIVDDAPKEEYDFIVDAIFTPTQVIKIKRKHTQPKGIIWDKISKHQIETMPLLQELMKASK
jgi:5-formyltetrahydrofolate cyclo-ligase